MFDLSGDITPEVLAKFPDVLAVTKAEEDVEAMAADICAVLDDALAAYNAMRAVEGEKLAADLANTSGPRHHHRNGGEQGGGALPPDRGGLPSAAGGQDAGGAAIHHHR